MIKSASAPILIAIGAVLALPACSKMFGGDQPRSTSAPATATAAQPVASDTVKQVQDKLKQQGYYKQGAVDGVWGAGTMTAVQNYQRDHDLTSSGKLDVPTLKSLNVADINSSASNPPTTNDTTPHSDNSPPPPAGSTDNSVNPR
jgi:peptidoglycan hydrolase-like protein with peptidoglycan-binding domain